MPARCAAAASLLLELAAALGASSCTLGRAACGWLLLVLVLVLATAGVLMAGSAGTLGVLEGLEAAPAQAAVR